MNPVVFHALLAVAACGLPRSADVDVLVEVEAGAHDRRDTPVTLVWPGDRPKPAEVVLEDPAGGATIPAQWTRDQPPTLVWIVPELKAGARRRFRLKEAGPRTVPTTVACLDDGRALTLTRGKAEVLRYNAATVESPPGLDPLYRRSGYIHPLTTPSGRVVTGDFAASHAHQHGLFFAWVNTTFDGRKVDFWNQLGKTGRVRHVETLATASGPVFGQFSVKLRHEDISKDGEPVPVLDEVWTVRALAIDGAGASVVDFESRQVCIAPTPLSVNTYHYGGFGLRGNTAWLDTQARGNDPPRPENSGRSDFLTSEGKTRADGNHTRPRWTDLSGDLPGGAAGVAILGHPGNFRYPQPVRIHPNMPYFCFAPMVLGAFPLEPGKPYVSRYRLVVHDGRPDLAAIERHWRDYSEPPRARVVSDAR